MNRPTLIALCVGVVLLLMVLFGPRLSSLSGQVSGAYQPDVEVEHPTGLSVELGTPFVCAAGGSASTGDLRTTPHALRILSGEDAGHSLVAFDLKEQLLSAGVDPNRPLQDWQLAFDLEKWTVASKLGEAKMD